MSQIDEFPHDYVPTVFDTHVADIEVDKKQVNQKDVYKNISIRLVILVKTIFKHNFN